MIGSPKESGFSPSFNYFSTKVAKRVNPEQACCMGYLFGAILVSLNIFTTILIYYNLHNPTNVSVFINYVYYIQTFWMTFDVILTFIGLCEKSAYDCVVSYHYVALVFHFFLQLASIGMIIPLLKDLGWGPFYWFEIPLSLCIVLQPVAYFIMISNMMSYKPRRAEFKEIPYQLVYVPQFSNNQVY
jgi:hypothetical protein